MIAGIDFLFWLVDTPTGLCYYKDANNITQKTPITNTLIDSHLKFAPGKWMDQQLSFTRNTTYYGINRSYSEPLLFVQDAASIIRELLYAGIGVETPLTLVVFKRNPSGIPTTYNLYYKGQIDLARFNDSCTEGISCNLMEGGILQLLKAYENTVFEIPCDGSIPENKKINFDGLLVQDTFNYQFVPIQVKNNNDIVIPSLFINNEGDNFGIVHNNPTYELALGSGGELDQISIQTSGNYLFYSIAPIKVRIVGSITVTPLNANFCSIGLYLATNRTYTNPSEYTSLLKGKVPGYGEYNEDESINNEYIATISSGTTFNFDQTISLLANEKLFMFFSSALKESTINFGSFQMIFESQALPTKCWGVTWFDVFRLLVQNICQAASTTNQTFNYGFKSQLLSDNLNMLITSGDALRASGDADYQKFFNAYNLNQTPNNNIKIEYGPVIKASLKDCFKAASIVFCGALGNELVNGVDTLFFEAMQYVFNPTDNVMSVGEFANMKVSLMNELMITGLKIGYQPQTYDEKAGKYEYNTTAEWVSNIKSVPYKVMDLVCPWRADSYGMERLRSGISSAPTSTTNNDSDNSVFIVNVDTSTEANDTETLTFTSVGDTDFNVNPNTNIRLVPLNSMQAVGMNAVNGSYLSLNNDPSIFVFAQQDLSANKNIVIEYDGLFAGFPANPQLGLPQDYVTIEVVVNGIVVDTQTFPATSAATTISHTYSMLAIICSTGNCIFLRISTSLNASGQLDNAQITVTNSDNSPYWQASGQFVPITPGTASALIAMPSVNDTYLTQNANRPSVSYGFQYYMFNSILNAPVFSYNYNITYATNGSSAETISFDFFKNGAIYAEFDAICNNTQVPAIATSNVSSDTLQIGDVFFVLSSITNSNAQILAATVVFTALMIKSYNLYRIQYDAVYGLNPDVMAALNNKTNVPGAAYNIEGLTPKRLLQKWSAWINSCLYNQPRGGLSFCTLSKNQYLVTVLGNTTIAENQNYPTSQMDPAFFYPLLLTADVDTPLNFSDTLTGAANGAVSGTFNGFNILGFPEHLSQKPALNETQSWELRCAASVDLTKLFNLSYTGLNNYTMLPGTIRSATLNSIKAYPQGITLDPKYRTPDPDNFPFDETVSGWVNQDGYANPWYTGYSIPLQFRANALAPITVTLYDCSGVEVNSTVFTQKTSPAVIYPDTLWEGAIPLTGVDPGYYYYVAQGGTSNGAFLQSEPIQVRAVDKADRIMLIEYSHSSNKAEMIFDTGFQGNFYLPGFKDNQTKPGFKGAFYVDQPQNIIIENGITYRMLEIRIVNVPDYVINQFLEIMMCDTVFIEGVQYTLNAQEDPEVEFTKGAPKKSWKMILRMAKNSTGVSASATGAVQDATMILTLDANAIMPNINNDSQSIEPNIIAVEITTS